MVSEVSDAWAHTALQDMFAAQTCKGWGPPRAGIRTCVSSQKEDPAGDIGSHLLWRCCPHHPPGFLIRQEPMHPHSRGGLSQQHTPRDGSTTSLHQTRCSSLCHRLPLACSSTTPTFSLKPFWSDGQILNFSQRRPPRANTVCWQGSAVLWGRDSQLISVISGTRALVIVKSEPSSISTLILKATFTFYTSKPKPEMAAASHRFEIHRKHSTIASTTSWCSELPAHNSEDKTRSLINTKELCLLSWVLHKNIAAPINTKQV